jgi:RNA-directed DNA polymerase
MDTSWFRKRNYRHLDFPTDLEYAKKVMDPDYVARRVFRPLLRFAKSEKRWSINPETNKKEVREKLRNIMYASHKDAAVLTYYSKKLTELLDRHYYQCDLHESIIAYRSLGMANYHFARDILTFAQCNSPVSIIAFDIHKFFDTLSHAIIKSTLKTILSVRELPKDWYKIYRHITNFHYYDIHELKKHAALRDRFKKGAKGAIASIEELSCISVSVHANPRAHERRGIPQGTPISAAIANLYMIDFDLAVKSKCDEIGGVYRRYSDDILIVCKPQYNEMIQELIVNNISQVGLSIAEEKTEVSQFLAGSVILTTEDQAQYLGFRLRNDGSRIRASSMSRQYKKLHAAIKATKEKAEEQRLKGSSVAVFTRSLRKKFSLITLRSQGNNVLLRNFSSYARKSAEVFGGEEKISRQIRRFERKADRLIRSLKVRK